MDFVVMLDRSAGNAEVGEMWTETKVFPRTATLEDVHMWVKERGGAEKFTEDELPRICSNVRISTAQ